MNEVYVDKDEAIYNLANAVIVSAVEDYRKALTMRDRCEIHSLEKFFRSEWYRLLTKVDGEYIIEQLRKEYHYVGR